MCLQGAPGAPLIVEPIKVEPPIREPQPVILPPKQPEPEPQPIRAKVAA